MCSTSSVGRATVLLTVGRGFEPLVEHLFFDSFAPLAQLVERTTVNREVTGSTPVWSDNESKDLKLLLDR